MEKFEAFIEVAAGPLGLVFFSSDDGVTITQSPRKGEAGKPVDIIFPKDNGWTIRPVEE